MTTTSELLNLVDRIGPGFHPDTPGDDYDSLPDGVTPTDVDRIVDAAFADRLDVYGIALDAVHATDPAYSEALARALAYSDSVGLSDGTDRPATTAAEASS